ncbi:DUF6192 family protein [Streptomyces sp. NPDC087300]|uniref:DUF6192 family protein n=1 Tax=Streptomyces sp. NPDC087300 TaxID=3365780 RepID=UPI0037F79E30
MGHVRAAADWLEGALDNGEFAQDEQLARLVKGEQAVACGRPPQPLSEYYGNLVRVSLREASPTGLPTSQTTTRTWTPPSAISRRS